MNTTGKIQSLLISHLVKHGSVELLLPDGVTLEVGITRVGKDGEVEKADNYCWVIASRGDKQTSLDKYNTGVKFGDREDVLVMEDRFVDERGRCVRRVDIV